jgi:hypothetical protein
LYTTNPNNNTIHHNNYYHAIRFNNTSGTDTIKLNDNNNEPKLISTKIKRPAEIFPGLFYLWQE